MADPVIMSEEDFEQQLEDLLCFASQEIEEDTREVDMDEFIDILAAFKGAKVRTYRQAGVLTGNRGLEVTTESGMTFQISIVQT